MIRVQAEAFDVGEELKRLKGSRTDIGGMTVFVGSVRDLGHEQNISSMTLEHYPGMTEQALADIETEARYRWKLLDTLIVHRYGKLEPGEDIVLVIAASSHRQEAFEACQFLIDWLKTKAPFWKLEAGDDGEHWVDAKDSDNAQARRWNNEPR